MTLAPPEKATRNRQSNLTEAETQQAFQRFVDAGILRLRNKDDRQLPRDAGVSIRAQIGGRTVDGNWMTPEIAALFQDLRRPFESGEE